MRKYYFLEFGRGNVGACSERVQGCWKGGKSKAGSEERKVVMEKYFHQEERLRMAESGQLGWVEREVEARQWDDQVGQSAWLLHRRCIQVPRIHLYTGVSSCVPPGHTCHTPCVGICWCIAGLYPGEEGGPEEKEEGYDAQERADGQVNSIPLIRQTKSIIRSLRLFQQKNCI